MLGVGEKSIGVVYGPPQHNPTAWLSGASDDIWQLTSSPFNKLDAILVVGLVNDLWRIHLDSMVTLTDCFGDRSLFTRLFLSSPIRDAIHSCFDQITWQTSLTQAAQHSHRRQEESVCADGGVADAISGAGICYISFLGCFAETASAKISNGQTSSI